MARPGSCQIAVYSPFVQMPALTLGWETEWQESVHFVQFLYSDSKITNVSQHPISPAARKGISEVIADLEKGQIASKTFSWYNSPTWLAWKPNGKWCLMIDLSTSMCQHRSTVSPAVHRSTAVPNTAHLTATLQAAALPWMAALDVKHVFFVILLQENDKEKFAFLGKVSNTSSTDSHRDISILPQLLMQHLLNSYKQCLYLRTWNYISI